ncbi:MAG: hypothetical protein RB292_04385 [Patescibacteria group bacterium]|jgi:hypothetical protein|nr:hypothetical protein [Patescibacteria group bacterium]
MIIAKLKAYWPLGLTLIFYLLLGGFYLLHHDWNFSAFSVIGPTTGFAQHFSDDNLYIIDEDPRGYDGRFFYFLSRAPFDLGTATDLLASPIWRYQRIFYPFLIYLLSLGGVAWLVNLWLPFVNLIAITLGTYFFIKLLQFQKIKNYFSLFFSLSPALIFGFLYNLGEPLAFALVVLAVYNFIKDRLGLAVWFLILAGLTKETTLFVSFGFIIYFLVNRPNHYLKKILLFSLPALIFTIWIVILVLIFGYASFLNPAGGNLVAPFLGMWLKAKVFLTQHWFYQLSDALFYLSFLLGAWYFLSETFKRLDFFNLIGLLYTVFAFTFSIHLLLFPKEYARHFFGFHLFLLLSYLATRRRLALAALLIYLSTSAFYLFEFLILLDFFR